MKRGIVAGLTCSVPPVERSDLDPQILFYDGIVLVQFFRRAFIDHMTVIDDVAAIRQR
ncbi:hypothetical protein D3C78_1963640 [compost metagenome]